MAEFSFFNKINLGRAFEHNLGPGGMEFGGGGKVHARLQRTGKN